MKKQEIKFNCQSLVSTWLHDCVEKKKYKVTNLKLVCDGNNHNTIIPCTVENAGSKLADLLYNNHGVYTQCKLVGNANGEEKEFGILNIE